jgi:hypothetical protein
VASAVDRFFDCFKSEDPFNTALVRVSAPEVAQTRCGGFQRSQRIHLMPTAIPLQWTNWKKCQCIRSDVSQTPLQSMVRITTSLTKIGNSFMRDLLSLRAAKFATK